MSPQMNHCTVIMLTSFKGGVGKSTITANLALSCAMLGKKSLVLDCDFNMRCLDLIMGYENDVVYDICDVVSHNISFEKAAICDARCDKLWFCAAPYNFKNNIDAQSFQKTVSDIKENYDFDFIFADTPGDSNFPFTLVTSVADRALICATHQPASIRAAEKTANLLDLNGICDRRLIINNFDLASVKKGTSPGIIDIIDRTYIQLIGVIPYSKKLSLLQERGALIDEIPGSDAACAFKNIAMRLCEKNVRLFQGFGSAYKSVVLK